MITGVHTMFYTSEPEALRAFLRDTLGLPHTDVGGGWLIFALPAAESSFASRRTASGSCSPVPPIRRSLRSARGTRFRSTIRARAGSASCSRGTRWSAA